MSAIRQLANFRSWRAADGRQLGRGDVRYRSKADIPTREHHGSQSADGQCPLSVEAV